MPPPTFIRQRPSYRVGGSVLLSALFVAVGCGGGRSEALREQARSLVPESAVILLEEDGDCVEFGPSPNCISTYFTIQGANIAERERLVRAVARATEWRFLGADRGVGGVQLVFKRGDYEGYVQVQADKRLKGCGQRVRYCRDHVYLVRG